MAIDPLTSFPYIIYKIICNRYTCVKKCVSVKCDLKSTTKRIIRARHKYFLSLSGKLLPKARMALCSACGLCLLFSHHRAVGEPASIMPTSRCSMACLNTFINSEMIIMPLTKSAFPGPLAACYKIRQQSTAVFKLESSCTRRQRRSQNLSPISMIVVVDSELRSISF